MYFFDGHCDTMLKIHSDTPCLFSFEEAIMSEGFFQIFAYFSEEDETDDRRALQTIKSFITYINSMPCAEIVYTPRQAENTMRLGKVAVMLALENCTCLGEDPENLLTFYNMGIRSITLTWNGENSFAHGCLCKNGGLKPAGRELVKLADRLGVLVDLSHLNQQSFYDVLSLNTGKIYASHSSSYAITPHPRNLTDEQIRAIHKRGGVVCACPNPPFISKDSGGGVDEFVAHVKHISKLTDGMGVGIGSDFDGTILHCRGIKTTKDIINLPAVFKQQGFEDYEIQNIFSCNLGRFLNIFPKK